MKQTKYQVFISSTYSDLEKEREGVIKAVLELYHIPIGMEMFSAEDEDQWEIIRRTIEVSDYYILILGLRYGSKTSAGISFTHKEYEYALEKKIPILAFVMDESVSLPQEKRDNDLTEIKSFRQTVLKNSKMAQFWKNKDELIKNVSISLMKQIMQKPGIGWVRGDKANSEEALSKEVAILSKENRELREVIIDLESKASQKRPKIEITISNLFIDENYNSVTKVTQPKTIHINDIEDKLKEFITESDVANYNEKIPSAGILEEYNQQLERFYKITKYATPLIINVCNAGTIKANNLFIDITFPKDLVVFAKDKEFEVPPNPIPRSPIVMAEAKYKKKIRDAQFSGLFSNMPTVSNSLSSLINPRYNLSHIRPINQKWWTKLEGDQLTIKIDDLIHTRCRNFDDEYMIVPLRAGVHVIEMQIICEELENSDIHKIELHVLENSLQN